jgi:inositol-1,3,4-trisphosphate 5/6-kinase
MKAPRQHDLMRQGLLPLMPTEDVFFIPVDVATTAHVAALQCLDVLLLKPTDFLERYPGSGVVPPFASSLQRLEAAVRCGTRAVVVGSLDDVYAIVDRDKMSTALEAACSTLRDRGYRARTAAWAVTGSLEPHALRHAAESACISPPCFIKPLLACGNPEAHAMAVVCRFKDSRDDGLRHVPCPAVVQEFIHHGGVLWKVYVAGGHVFVKQRPSLPDIDVQGAEGDDDEESCASTTSPWAVTFHSLQEMPTRWPWKGQSTEDSDPKTGVSTKVLSEQINAKSGVLSKSEDEGGLEQRDAVLRELAKELQARLRLGLFGFDVLFDAKDGCPVVVDVNYFPSYKDIPGAASAVRAMLKAALHECKNTGKAHEQNN